MSFKARREDKRLKISGDLGTRWINDEIVIKGIADRSFTLCYWCKI